MNRLLLLFNVLGIGALASTVLLQILVFLDIATQGYFLAVEPNSVMVKLETGITVLAATYLVYVFQKFVRSA